MKKNISGEVTLKLGYERIHSQGRSPAWTIISTFLLSARVSYCMCQERDEAVAMPTKSLWTAVLMCNQCPTRIPPQRYSWYALPRLRLVLFGSSTRPSNATYFSQTRCTAERSFRDMLFALSPPTRFDTETEAARHDAEGHRILQTRGAGAVQLSLIDI